MNRCLPAPTHTDLYTAENQNLNNATNTLKDIIIEFGVQQPVPNPYLLSNEDGQKNRASFTYEDTETEQFWFHSDHLGSSNYISNIVGYVTQHMEYLPFGETLVEEHLNSNNSPFRFNAKELDEETGNYYYGARYYDPKWSIWISVDPLAEKYPSISSYAYVANNPLRYIDPDGMRITDPKSKRKASQLKSSLELMTHAVGMKERMIIASATKDNGTVKLSKSQRTQLSELRTTRMELQKSISDLNDMERDPFNDYSYRDASGNNGKPETKKLGAFQVVMFSDSFGNDIHEGRHGGQIARGEYDIDENRNITFGSFGASKEIDAYRAQFAADGEFFYLPKQDDNDLFANKLLENDMIQPLLKTIKSFDEINHNFLKSASDVENNKTEHIYHPSNKDFYEK